MTRKKLVEVAVPRGDDHVPLGIMTAHQAFDLPLNLEFKVSHPDHEPGATDLFVDRSVLRDHLGSSWRS
jgi:hypothetical protein